MEFIVYLVIFIVGIIIVAALNSATDSTNAGRDLAEKFKGIGIMSGLHKDEIIKIVGLPQSFSQIGNDTLLQWIVPGYHIAIMFDMYGYFIGISSEVHSG